jgi:dolichol-phosphate mannosyltransferase
MIRFAADAFLGYSMILLLLRFSAMAAFVLLLALIGLAIYSIYGWLYLDPSSTVRFTK